MYVYTDTENDLRRSKRRNKKDFENYFKWSSSDESDTNSDLDPEFIPNEKNKFKTEEDDEDKTVKKQKLKETSNKNKPLIDQVKTPLFVGSHNKTSGDLKKANPKDDEDETIKEQKLNNFFNRTKPLFDQVKADLFVANHDKISEDLKIANLEQESYQSNLAISKHKEENICVASSYSVEQNLAKTSHSIESMDLPNKMNNQASGMPGVVRISLGRRRKKS